MIEASLDIDIEEIVDTAMKSQFNSDDTTPAALTFKMTKGPKPKGGGHSTQGGKDNQDLANQISTQVLASLLPAVKTATSPLLSPQLQQQLELWPKRQLRR